MATQEDGIGDVIARLVRLRKSIPAQVVGGHHAFRADGFRADRSEAHLGMGRLAGVETQENARRVPGRQFVMRPVSNTAPSSQVSVNRPPSFGSNANAPADRGVKRKRPFRRHQGWISRTNTPKARPGGTATHIRTRLRDVMVPAPDAS